MPETKNIKENLPQDPPSSYSYEYNSYFNHRTIDVSDIFGSHILDRFTPEEIRSIVSDPVGNHNLTRKLALYVYNSEGVVANTIDYLTALLCLDRVICGKKRFLGKKKLERNKEILNAALESINDRQFIRDVLFADMNEGTSFYYLETTASADDKTKFLRDYDVETIYEICDMGMNATMIPLPYEYCKIVGRKNGRYVIAFDLRYFDQFSMNNAERDRKLKKYPAEIRDGWIKWNSENRSSGSWLVLDNNHTIAHKIKCKISEPWGRPLAMAAIEDIIYQNEFVDTKRNILQELNNKIIYQTFPEGKDKGSCALTEKQQKNQHTQVKQAVMNKNNRGGTSFFSVAAGTKLNVLDVSAVDIFDEKNEANLSDKIAMDLGIASSLLNGSGSGNYSSQENNLELIHAQLYSWVQEIQNELNYVINACIIKDYRNKVEVCYLPTSLVNRQKFFEMMKSLYLEAGGSYTFLVASTGVNPDVYFNVLDDEVERKIFDKYQPHKTSYTTSGNDKGGRPENNDPTNPSSIQTKARNANAQPKPSTK